LTKVYFVSGLGADERAFQFLQLPHIEPVYIKWLPPFKKELIQDYAARLIASQIDTQSEINLVGLSFGGMVCQEIAKQIPCRRVVIISSIKSAKEMGWLMRLSNFLRFEKPFSAAHVKKVTTLMAHYFFDVHQPNEQQLLKEIIDDTDTVFLKWAIGVIRQWDNKVVVPHLTHLHGTSDRVFPFRNVKNALAIAGGGHYMVANRAEEVSRLLVKALE
jgi:pimeloyl-ACP methyl ester carboxylesterase